MAYTIEGRAGTQHHSMFVPSVQALMPDSPQSRSQMAQDTLDNGRGMPKQYTTGPVVPYPFPPSQLLLDKLPAAVELSVPHPPDSALDQDRPVTSILQI